MKVADPIVALIAYVVADPDVGAMVAERVFGDELPDREASSMPRAAVVLKVAGSSINVEGDSKAAITSYRVDAWSYGATPYSAGQLRSAVYGRLKELERVVVANVLIHSAIRESGPIPIRDPETHWPIKVESFRVLVSDVETTGE